MQQQTCQEQAVTQADITARLKERLDGQARNVDFERLLLDVVQLSYGTVGRNYLQTRLWMAASLEIALVDGDDGLPTGIGNA